MIKLNEQTRKSFEKVCQKVSLLEGAMCPHHPDDELAVLGGHYNDYLVIALLGKLLAEGHAEIRIAEIDLPYFKKLLHTAE